MVGWCPTTSFTDAAWPPPLTTPSFLLAGTPLLEECSKLLLGETLIQEGQKCCLAISRTEVELLNFALLVLLLLRGLW